jgi:hypothetical protein
MRNGKVTNIEIIANNHHRCITASALTFYFNDGEFTILRCLPRFYPAQLGANRVQNLRRAL